MDGLRNTRNSRKRDFRSIHKKAATHGWVAALFELRGLLALAAVLGAGLGCGFAAGTAVGALFSGLGGDGQCGHGGDGDEGEDGFHGIGCVYLF